MVILPIRTESDSRRTPLANYLLIGVNLVAYLVLRDALFGPQIDRWRDRYLVLQSAAPTVHQFFTYQFIHADGFHLLGNLLFLFVFGNGVNGKMGDVPYILFYLAGGVFAGWGYAMVSPTDFQLMGASGAIASVTTAYLALFPRSRVTVLFWFFLIHFFEVPAMLLIGVKIIVWDNILAPSVMGSGNVAHGAHLAGYLFGFVGVMFLLLIRALPRDQFDILSLWRRWHLRREMATVMNDPSFAGPGHYGRTARPAAINPQIRENEDRRVDELADLRQRVEETLGAGDAAGAAGFYERLLALDSRQCLAEQPQLAVAREFLKTGKFELAATSFERYLDCYPGARDAADVRMLLGIIYARDLGRYQLADRHLSQCMETLHDPTRIEQCARWLDQVRSAVSPSKEGAPDHDASG